MSVWTKRRSQQLIALLLMTGLLALGGALVAYADSTPAHLVGVVGDQSRPGSVATGTITATVPPPTATPSPVPPANVIVNGGFEDGFVEGQGVGVGWGRFESGYAFAGWYDDTWTKVVYEGKHAQLLELKNATQQDRAFVGIFQTVNVVPNADYMLTLHGLVRSTEGSPAVSSGGYRMQYGIDFKGGTNWQSPDVQWVELPWDDQPREDPTGQNVYRMETFTASVKAQTNKLTLFIRAQKKWPDGNEGNYDIDGVSLVGAQQGGAQPTPTPTAAPGLPKTGYEVALENPVLVLASAAMLIVLVGGAAWGVSRRRL